MKMETPVIRGRILYQEDCHCLGEAFVCQEQHVDQIATNEWSEVKCYFIVRGTINWDILRIMRNWQKNFIPYEFVSDD